MYYAVLILVIDLSYMILMRLGLEEMSTLTGCCLKQTLFEQFFTNNILNDILKKQTDIVTRLQTKGAGFDSW